MMENVQAGYSGTNIGAGNSVTTPFYFAMGDKEEANVEVCYNGGEGEKVCKQFGPLETQIGNEFANGPSDPHRLSLE